MKRFNLRRWQSLGLILVFVILFQNCSNIGFQPPLESSSSEGLKWNPPVISSLTTSLASLTSGQSATLSWATSGATSLSLSGIGSVTGKTSQVVTPTTNTTYTLTATNSVGSVTASVSIAVVAPTSAPTPAGKLIALEQFESSILPANYGFQGGATLSISTDVTKNYNSSKGSIRATYPIPSGGVYAWGGYSVAQLNTYEVYVDFRAKMPGAKHGLKFIKVFGGNAGGNTNNYANTTFALDYTGIDNGSMQYIGFGDGSGIANDTANGVWLDGSTDQPGAYHGVGRSAGKALVQSPQKQAWGSANWGTGWHHFQFHVKFNSGTTAQNEVADGALDVIIDGVTYVHATGLLNRHYSNAPISQVQLFGWSQAGAVPFEIWYDDVKISTNGWP